MRYNGAYPKVEKDEEGDSWVIAKMSHAAYQNLAHVAEREDMTMEEVFSEASLFYSKAHRDPEREFSWDSFHKPKE